MEGFVRGEVVVVPFPFSDLSSSKKRPAYVIADLLGDDIILCQITSSRNDCYSVSLSAEDFQTGQLPTKSSIRPNRLFTADKSIIQYKIGLLTKHKIKNIEESVINLIRNA